MIQNSTVPGDATVLFLICKILVAGHLPVIALYQVLQKGPAIGAPVAHRAPQSMNQNHHLTSAKAQASPYRKARRALQTRKKSGVKAASLFHPLAVNQKRDLEVYGVEATWRLLRTTVVKKVIGEVPLALEPVASLVRFFHRTYLSLFTLVLVLASNSTPPTPQMGRRKLELLPRSGNASATPSPLSSPKMGPTPPTSSSSTRANPFGAARYEIHTNNP